MAKHPLGSRQAALCAWLTDNGINPADVPQDADITIDKGPTRRFLRCEVYDRTPDGHLQAGPDDRVATMVVNVPLKVEPPDWWQPQIKPTRDQLLDAVQLVRALVDAGPPSEVAVHGEWGGGWDSAMEAVKKALDSKVGP
jgi:hypothetical protein